MVTWSCDGPFPARRSAAAKARAIHCIQPRRDWAKRLAAQPTDRQTTRINQRETKRTGVSAPGVIWLCAVDSLRARARARFRRRRSQKNGHCAMKFDRENDFANLFSIVRPCEIFFTTENVIVLSEGQSILFLTL